LCGVRSQRQVRAGDWSLQDLRRPARRVLPATFQHQPAAGNSQRRQTRDTASLATVGTNHQQQQHHHYFHDDRWRLIKNLNKTALQKYSSKFFRIFSNAFAEFRRSVPSQLSNSMLRHNKTFSNRRDCKTAPCTTSVENRQFSLPHLCSAPNLTMFPLH